LPRAKTRVSLGEATVQMMSSFTNALVPIAIGVVLAILLLGLWNMMRGGSPNRSQNLMRARVIAQFVAILVAMGALWLKTR